MKLRWILVASLMLAAVLVAIVITDRQPKRGEFCTADVGATHAQIDMEQAQWTTLMAAIAQRDGLPPRATTIAIATAFQESRIHNIDYGDLDSVGLFQQRPSQGWGTQDQLLDPVFAIERFHAALAKVDDYETMRITEAAQHVQRSRFPGAYAQHEDYARALSSALRGYSTAAFSCTVNPTGGGIVSNIDRDIRTAFGDIPVVRGNTTLTLPLRGESQDISARGWGLAHYAVGNSSRLQIASVSFDGMRWTAKDSPDGWRPAPQAGPGQVTISVQ